MPQKYQTVRISDHDHSFLNFLYLNTLGRCLLKILIRPCFSKLIGFFLDTGLSKKLIPNFIKKNNIVMSDYQDTSYRSFNDFFKRRIKPAARPFPSNPSSLISPCDSKLSAYHIDQSSIFKIKNSLYRLQDLLQDEDAAKTFNKGTLLIFRLSPEDYHHYYYIDNGQISGHQKIQGVLHTVRPIASDTDRFYTRNSRECTYLTTENFGEICQIEVGAMLVGKISNKSNSGSFQRFSRKGCFEFGGSTVVLVFQENKISLDPEIFKNTASNLETIVKLGQVIGKKQDS